MMEHPVKRHIVASKKQETRKSLFINGRLRNVVDDEFCDRRWSV
jgi:hypothetical protein